MDITVYHWIHAAGLMAVFMGFGLAIANRVSQGEIPSVRKTAAILHGTGLLVLLVSGFGALARLGLMGELPLWVWMKLGVWLALGGMIAIIKRAPVKVGILALLVLFLGMIAAYSAIWKPLLAASSS